MVTLHIETETEKGSRIHSKYVRSDVASCVATTEGGGVGTTRSLSSVQSERRRGGGRNNSSLGRRLLKRRAITAVDKRPL